MWLVPSFLDRLGFLASIAAILWLPFVTIGTFTVTIYSSYFGYGWLGLGAFVGANTMLAYFFNKSRKHRRQAAFDDRLTSERMDNAREWWMSRKDREE